MDQAEPLKQVARKSSTQVVYLQGILRDLFIDYHKLSTGSEPTSKLKQLDHLLTQDELLLEDVLRLFNTPGSNISL